ncbi:hypothetical protein DWX10_24165 [Clostridium sp. AF18-27]|nr:hypothetical protein DWX10_24165 [Clostridium sp. AF18-27]
MSISNEIDAKWAAPNALPVLHHKRRPAAQIPGTGGLPEAIVRLHGWIWKIVLISVQFAIKITLL